METIKIFFFRKYKILSFHLYDILTYTFFFIIDIEAHTVAEQKVCSYATIGILL